MNIRCPKCRHKNYITITKGFYISDDGEVNGKKELCRNLPKRNGLTVPIYAPPDHFHCKDCGARWRTSDKNRQIKVPKGYRVYDVFTFAEIVKTLDPMYLP